MRKIGSLHIHIDIDFSLTLLNFIISLLSKTASLSELWTFKPLINHVLLAGYVEWYFFMGA